MSRTAAPARSIRVLGSDLRVGDLVYVCGKWQTLVEYALDADGEHFRDRTDRGSEGLGNARSYYDVAAPRIVDTDHRCACDQQITVVQDERGYYSECGGEGEGACDLLLNATDHCRDAAIAHRTAIASVERPA